MRGRTIVHIDIDAFFAAVEELLHPELKGKPIVVGGLPHERGVAATCNYEARRFGLHSGMPLRQAYELCPQAAFLRGNYQLYQAFSEKFFRLLYEYTPDVEEASLDEAYLELTRCRLLYADFSTTAKEIKARVERELGLKVSMGIGPNKILAKLATKKAKPGGFFEVREGEVEDFLRDLDIEAIPGIGPKAQVELRLLGIHKISDLWGLPRAALRQLFGLSGEEIYLQARGIDARPVASFSLLKSISRETTFLEDIWDKKLLLAHLAYLSDRLSLALGEENLYAHIIEVKIRLADFRNEVKRRLLVTPVQDMTSIYRVAKDLFLQLYSSCRLALRLVGVKASDLVRARSFSLFEAYCDRFERLGQALNQVREKYGFGAILTARERMLEAVYPLEKERGFVLKTASLTR